MNEIRALLKIAARRLDGSVLLGKVHIAAIVFLGVALALMIADRMTAAAFVPWLIVAPALALAAIAVAAALWTRSRPSESHVALLVDERLDLREKLSTALHVANRDDAFARAAVEDAVNAARDPQNHERARRRFPVAAPGGWWISPLMLAMVVMVSLLQPLDLFARDAEQTAEAVQVRHEVDEALDAIVQQIADQPQLSNELSDLLAEMGKPGADTDALRSPEQVRRDAIKRVTELNERLNEIINGTQGKSMDSLDKALRELRTPEDGPAKELAEAMAAGDFQAAQEALKDLIDKAESGELTPEQQQQLVEQLKDIAQQLENLAQKKQELEEALKQAGLDPQLAQNPQALEQALENNENLNEQQKQQLQQMAQAQQAANNMCQGLGAAAMQLAQAMEAGQAGQAGEAMAGQLGELEALQMMLQQAQAAANACQGSCQGLGQNLGLQSALAQWGNAMQRGEDGGGRRGVAPTPTRTRVEQVKGQTGEGDIIARMLVDGPQVVGESRVTPSQIVAEVVEGFEEGLDEDQLPRRYHEAHKRYFGELERRARESSSGESVPAQPSPSKEE